MPEDSPTVAKPFLGLSGTQTMGSALAAVTSAVVGSFLGVAGTLIGAALGSIVATIAGALYARTLDSAAGVAKRKLESSRSNFGRRRPAEDPLEDTPLSLANAVASEKDKARKLTPKAWIRIASVSAAAFAVAIIGITAFEFGTSKPISSLVTASSTSSEDGAVRTTLGAALTGQQTVSDDSEPPAEENQQAPAEGDGNGGTEGSTVEETSPAPVDDVNTDPAVPGTDVPDATQPADPGTDTGTGTETVPATEPVPEDGTGTDQSSGLDAPSDLGGVQGPADGTGAGQ
ncbi:hypothetical protein [Arthrobacter sp. USHLN218]|uniref:hypothetical protein n=1 Tax=Arthrobacter sp. USHLN218 TaxID=3081232 RepID=UPI00301A7B7A